MPVAAADSGRLQTLAENEREHVAWCWNRWTGTRRKRRGSSRSAAHALSKDPRVRPAARVEAVPKQAITLAARSASAWRAFTVRGDNLQFPDSLPTIQETLMMKSAFLATDTSPDAAEARTCVMCPALCCFETLQPFLLTVSNLRVLGNRASAQDLAHTSRSFAPQTTCAPALTDSRSNV
jgi:hypothetical protein